jgi:hypothetical protein
MCSLPSASICDCYAPQLQRTPSLNFPSQRSAMDSGLRLKVTSTFLVGNPSIRLLEPAPHGPLVGFDVLVDDVPRRVRPHAVSEHQEAGSAAEAAGPAADGEVGPVRWAVALTRLGRPRLDDVAAPGRTVDLQRTREAQHVGRMHSSRSAPRRCSPSMYSPKGLPLEPSPGEVRMRRCSTPPFRTKYLAAPAGRLFSEHLDEEAGFLDT